MFDMLQSGKWIHEFQDSDGLLIYLWGTQLRIYVYGVGQVGIRE